MLEENITKLYKLLEAAGNADMQGMTKAIAEGAQVNGQYPLDGITALMFAVMPNKYGDHNTGASILETAKFLLSNGADPRIKDMTGMRAVDYARRFLDGSEDKFGEVISDNYSDADKSQIIKVIELLGDRDSVRE